MGRAVGKSGVATGLAGSLLVWALLGLSPPTPTIGAGLRCARAQLVDGQLRCEDELLHDLRELCVGTVAHALAPGDAIDGACGDHPVTRMPPEQLAALGQAVDLNRAGIDEIASLPGIGPKLAARIVAGRPYASVDELSRVSGIGPKRLAAIRARARARE